MKLPTESSREIALKSLKLKQKAVKVHLLHGEIVLCSALGKGRELEQGPLLWSREIPMQEINCKSLAGNTLRHRTKDCLSLEGHLYIYIFSYKSKVIQLLMRTHQSLVANICHVYIG